MIELESRIAGLPRDRAIECIERIEELAPTLEDGYPYPKSWWCFRIFGEVQPGDSLAAPGSGLQPEKPSRARRLLTRTKTAAATSPMPEVPSARREISLTGKELKRELPIVVERLCDPLDLRAGQPPLIETSTTTDLEKRWTVSRATLNRWRRDGLVGWRVRQTGNRQAVVFRSLAIERFETERADLLRGHGLARAGLPHRLSAAEQRSIEARALVLRESGLSLHKAALQLANEMGRSVEGLRQHLVRSGIFTEDPSLDAARRREVLRLLIHGGVPSEIAKRFGRGVPAIRRAAVLARVELLKEWQSAGEFNAPEGPTFHWPGAGEPLLAVSPVREGLGYPGPESLLDLLREVRVPRAHIPAEESARAIAYCYLRFDAARQIVKLDTLHPRASEVDQIETRLRWAARLKAELVRSQLSLLIETIESAIEQKIESLGQADADRVVQAGIARLAAAVDLYDPFRGGRLAGASSLVLARFANQLPRRAESGLATKRAMPRLSGDMPISDFTRSVCRWQEWLEPLINARAAAKLAEPTRSYVESRFGLNGKIPKSLSAAAKEAGLSLPAAAVREREVLAGVRVSGEATTRHV